MNHPIVFNHHSLPFNSIANIDTYIVDFIKICLKCCRIGFRIILIDNSIDNNWFRVELSNRYYWQDWYNANANNSDLRDEIRAFRLIKTKNSLFNEEIIEDEIYSHDVYLQTTHQRFEALKSALWNECPLLSFPSRHPWISSPVQVIIDMMNESGEIESKNDKIINLFSLTFLQSIEYTLRKKIQSVIDSGKKLLDDQIYLYPLLCLCGKAKEQLLAWEYPINILDQIKESLIILNAFSEGWNDGSILGYTHAKLHALGLQHEVSGESTSVKQDPKLRKTREFYLPSGKLEFFENHIKFSKGIRLHFFADKETRSIFIGYIGSHLPL